MALHEGISQAGGSSPFDIAIKLWDFGDWLVISPRGDLDIYNSGLLRDQIGRSIDAGRFKIVIDLRDVDFLDSDGMGVLFGGLKRTRSLGGDLRLAAVGSQISRTLAVTGLSEVFSVGSSVAEVTGTGDNGPIHLSSL